MININIHLSHKNDLKPHSIIFSTLFLSTCVAKTKLLHKYNVVFHYVATPNKFNDQNIETKKSNSPHLLSLFYIKIIIRVDTFF